jgi:hypothetical protein
MAEEKNSNNKLKVKITDGFGWTYDKFYPQGSVVEIDQATYDSMSKHVQCQIINK